MPTRSSIAGLRQPTIEREHGGHETQFGIIRKAALYAGHGPGTVKLFMDLWGQEKVSWFLSILPPIDLNFRIHHVDQQVHCPFEGLPQYRTQRRSLRSFWVLAGAAGIEHEPQTTKARGMKALQPPTESDC